MFIFLFVVLCFGFCVARSITKQFQIIWAKNIKYILHCISTYQKIYFKTKLTRKRSAPVQKYMSETRDLKSEAVLL